MIRRSVALLAAVLTLTTSAQAGTSEEAFAACVKSHQRYFTVIALAYPKEQTAPARIKFTEQTNQKCACFVDRMEVDGMDTETARHMNYMFSQMFSTLNEKEGRLDMALNQIDQRTTAALALKLASQAPACERPRR